MLRIALAALVVTSFVGSASAQQVICADQFKDFWEKLMQQGTGSKLTGEQLAAFHRTALRGYDSCTAGDEQFATKLFEKLALEHSAGAKK